MSKYFDNKQSFMEPVVQQYNNHMVMTNVMKHTKTKYINIDTKYREEDSLQEVTEHYDYSTYRPPASYTIQLPERVNDVKSISIRTAEIPMTMYNVSQYLNNNAFKLEYTVNSVVQSTRTFVIPNGYYTMDTLSSKISALINASPTPFSSAMFFSINTDKRASFVSNKTVTGNFILHFAVNELGEPRTTLFKNTLGWMLGFRKSKYTLPPATYAISEDVAMIKQTKYLYIVIDEFSKGNQTSFLAPLTHSYIRKNILAKVILNEVIYPSGSIFPANILNGYLMSDKREYNGKIDIQKLLVQLVDENDNLVDLNGSDLSLTLQVEYE